MTQDQFNKIVDEHRAIAAATPPNERTAEGRDWPIILIGDTTTGGRKVAVQPQPSSLQEKRFLQHILIPELFRVLPTHAASVGWSSWFSMPTDPVIQRRMLDSGSTKDDPGRIETLQLYTACKDHNAISVARIHRTTRTAPPMLGPWKYLADMVPDDPEALEVIYAEPLAFKEVLV
jgi:hypothetical protein